MFKQLALLFGTILLASPVVTAQQPAQPQRPAALQSVDDRTSGMKKIDGYFPLYWDERTGALFVEISRLDTDFLFSTGLSAGRPFRMPWRRAPPAGPSTVFSIASTFPACSAPSISQAPTQPARSARTRQSPRRRYS